MLPDPQTLFFALLGGILPALFWLWFWLKEDKNKPEPRGLIILSFIAGMSAVAIVLPLEKWAFESVKNTELLIVSWAAIEEIVKFLAIFLVAFSSRYFDEPVDALIYMITVALGFAALENTLFLLSPIGDGQIVTSLLTGNLRFMGATLLHVAASASIGIALGLTFYKKRLIRYLSGLVGLFTAILLHTLFNFFIINSNGASTFTVFLGLWGAIIIIILFFEKIKKIKLKHGNYA